jgi:hypothetical protein
MVSSIGSGRFYSTTISAAATETSNYTKTECSDDIRSKCRLSVNMRVERYSGLGHDLTEEDMHCML